LLAGDGAELLGAAAVAEGAVGCGAALFDASLF
jgi:hypothetical protein